MGNIYRVNFLLPDSEHIFAYNSQKEFSFIYIYEVPEF